MKPYDAFLVAESADQQSVALIFEGKEFTYEQMRLRISSLALYMKRNSVMPGDHVALIASNHIAHIEVLYACMCVGAVCEYHNVRMSNEVIGGLLELSRPKLLITTQTMWAALQIAKPDIHSGVLLLDEESYDNAVGSFTGVLELYQWREDEIVLSIDTSGTTGVPKQVLLPYSSICVAMERDIRECCLTEGDRMLFSLPLFHVTCLTFTGLLACGATVVVGKTAKPETMLGEMIRYRVTVVGMVPSLLRDFLDFVSDEESKALCLRLVICGGDRLPNDLARLACMKLDCEVLQAYGMTETASMVTALRLSKRDLSSHGLSVGKVIEGASIRAIGPSGEICAPGQRGELEVMCKTSMVGYLGRKNDVLRDGWYRTGDIGYVDGQGFIYLTGRKHDMIISGGENIYPSEIAECIRELACVEDVYVVPAPSKRWGQTPAAFIRLKDGEKIDAKEIQDYCSKKLGSFKKPSQVIFVESFPHSPSGKVSTAILRERAERLVQTKC